MSLSSFALACLILFQSGDARVELEIVMEGGSVIGKQQEWLKSLSAVGADSLRMRSAERGERLSIKKSESGGTTTYKVIGQLSGDNRLRLPGGTYRLGDMDRVKTWIAGVKAGSLEEQPAPKMAFGLSGDQLVGLHERMAVPTGIPTKGVAVADVLRSIRKQSQIKITVDDSAADAVKTDMTVNEELEKMSCGTALAAIIRPLGLVAVPVLEHGTVNMQLTDARKAKEHWPIGWPAEKAPRDVAPKLFEYLEVEIDDYALNETLDAIEAKSGVPFVYDQNSLLLNDIEPTEINVSFPAKRTYYYNVLRRVTGQTDPKMKVELRVDEAGNPFIWLTTY